MPLQAVQLDREWNQACNGAVRLVPGWRKAFNPEKMGQVARTRQARVHPGSTPFFSAAGPSQALTPGAQHGPARYNWIML